MTDDVIEGEVVEHAIELRAPANLFGTQDPRAVVQRASETARELADVIKQRHLTSRIQGKEHVQVEGWTLLGSMLGVFPVLVWTKEIENGWEARVEARTLAGNVVGAAEAMCTRDESTWSKRDGYALRSMAQTRATSKALRQPLGFIMHLAGYSPTPAEEMDFSPPAQTPPGSTAENGGRGELSSTGSTSVAPASTTSRQPGEKEGSTTEAGSRPSPRDGAVQDDPAAAENPSGEGSAPGPSSEPSFDRDHQLEIAVTHYGTEAKLVRAARMLDSSVTSVDDLGSSLLKDLILKKAGAA